MTLDFVRRCVCVLGLWFATAALGTGQVPWYVLTGLNAPSARNSHAMVYDIARSTGLVFGGYDGTATALGDTWEMAPTTWTRRFPAISPQARWGHTMVYDKRRDRTILFGGYSPTQPGGWLADTWEWDGNSWTQVAVPTPPPARGYHSMVYDSWRGRTILFGGASGTNQPLDDTWVYDGSAWSQVTSTTRPSPRTGMAMAFQTTNGQVVLFGGGDGNQVFDDTWVFDGSVWQQRLVTVHPTARQAACMAQGAMCGEARLFGGADLAFTTNYSDTWEWNGTSWLQRAALQNPAPTARHGAAMAYDDFYGRFFVWGGRTATGFLQDTGWGGAPCRRQYFNNPVPGAFIGRNFNLNYSYPPLVVGHLGLHLLSLEYPGNFPVSIPGFTSSGSCFVDLQNIQWQSWFVTDASGFSSMSVPIPQDRALLGIRIEAQSVDVDLNTNAVFWADGGALGVISDPNPPPVANFTCTRTQGVAGMSVTFYGTSSTNATSWQWDFQNDGIVDSVSSNAVWVYSTPGTYSVRLTVTGPGGTSTNLATNLIYAWTPPATTQPNLIAVPAGTFQMGSTLSPASQPVHTVHIQQPFWIGKYEVTQLEFENILPGYLYYRAGYFDLISPQRPMFNLDHDLARAYCNVLNQRETAAGRVPAGYQYRLPTEAEWEYCCRAGTTTEYHTGNTISCSEAYVGGPCGISVFVDVGSYPANAWGIHDMVGNVYEWCADAFAAYPAGPVTDPYTRTGSFRVQRGGSYNTGFAASGARFSYVPSTWHPTMGMRVVLAPIIAP